MLKPNMNYAQLKGDYLFEQVAQKAAAYLVTHPGAYLYRMGVGDVTLPLCREAIRAIHSAADDQASAETFHGYMPETGAPFLRQAIAAHYRTYGADLSDDEIFVSTGASNELGDILDLFDRSSSAMVIEPAYPAYADTSIMAGRSIVRLQTGMETGFLAMPCEEAKADILYICSPNNPTGAAYSRQELQKWVDFANANGSVILFDAAYEAFIEDSDVPHSIFELDGAEDCAIEICSLSKTAGFTGTRLGYTVIPKSLQRMGMNFRDMWIRNRTTKSNGVSYIIQRAGAAVFSPEGQRQIRENIAYYKENAAILMQALDDSGIVYCGGRNAPYIWLRCPGGMSGWEFFDRLLNGIQVVGTPGEGFGACGAGYMRFSTLRTREDTLEAAERLRQFLRR